jgi:VanZ family protein
MQNRSADMSSQKNFIRYHLPLILYACAIIVVSSLPQAFTPKLGFKWSDKFLHFAEYAFFAWLTFRSFAHINRRMTINRAFLLSFLFLVVFAGLDELHQHYIPGRDPALTDLLGDLLGGIFVLVLLRLFILRRQRKSAVPP